MKRPPLYPALLHFACFLLLALGASTQAMALTNKWTLSQSFSPSDRFVVTNEPVTISNTLSMTSGGSVGSPGYEEQSGGPTMNLASSLSCAGPTTPSSFSLVTSTKVSFFATDTNAGGSCTYSHTVKSATRGEFTSSFALTSGTYTVAPTTQKYYFVDRPTASISAPTSLIVGNAGTATVTIGNTNGGTFSFNNANLSVNLASGLAVGSGSSSNTCGGTLTASAGASSISVSGATLSGASCQVSFPIKAIGSGAQTVSVSSSGFNALAYYEPSGPTSSSLFKAQAVSATVDVVGPPVFVGTTTLPAGTVDTPYSFNAGASGTHPIAYAVTSGMFPPGLLLNSQTGSISGIPSSGGSFSFGITASNSIGSTTQIFSVVINAPPIGNSQLSALPPGTIDAAYSVSVATSGTTPINYAINGGALPPGLTLGTLNGTISGTPQTRGSYYFGVTASNIAGSASQLFRIDVGLQPSLPEPPNSNNGNNGQSSVNGPVANPNQPLPPPPIFQTTYLVSDGRMPAQAVNVSVLGTYGNATINVTLDLGQVLGNSFASGYNVYLAAQVPGARLGLYEPTWFMKPATQDWLALGFPLSAFLENVASGSIDERRVISLVANTDLSRLVGTEFYLGYGLSSDEMLASKRYRGIYKVSLQ